MGRREDLARLLFFSPAAVSSYRHPLKGDPRMPMLRRAVLFFLVLCWCASAAAEDVPITVIQINDVYEISPVEGGKEGGLARLATLRRELARENPRTFLVLAGDAFSPSALGTAVVDGQPLAGAQMIAALNA